MNNSNRRKFKRLRIDRFVKIPVQLFPVMPFIGESIEAHSVDISAGGMALRIEASTLAKSIKRRSKIKIHFRLPGHSLQECQGTITHVFKNLTDRYHIGIRFTKIPKRLFSEIQQMSVDNDACNTRIQIQNSPWCIPTCSFFSLCRKPIRPDKKGNPTTERFEISVQAV